MSCVNPYKSFLSKQWCGSLSMLIAFLGFFCAGLGLGLALSWQADNRELRQFAISALGHAPSSLDDIARLNTQIYKTQGFAKNRHFFCWEKLGATPLQILHYGGDCADKSRLLAAILGEYGISSTLVMLYSSAQGKPLHTVVEARLTDTAMVVDPVYDINFPDGVGNYHGINSLRTNSEILVCRLRELIEERGIDDKIARYEGGPDGANYEFPRTINLYKNSLLRTFRRALGIIYTDPDLVSRPRFLEDPKLFLSLTVTVLASVFLSLAMLL